MCECKYWGKRFRHLTATVRYTLDKGRVKEKHFQVVEIIHSGPLNNRIKTVLKTHLHFIKQKKTSKCRSAVELADFFFFPESQPIP